MHTMGKHLLLPLFICGGVIPSECSGVTKVTGLPVQHFLYSACLCLSNPNSLSLSFSLSLSGTPFLTPRLAFCCNLKEMEGVKLTQTGEGVEPGERQVQNEFTPIAYRNSKA